MAKKPVEQESDGEVVVVVVWMLLVVLGPRALLLPVHEARGLPKKTAQVSL